MYVWSAKREEWTKIPFQASRRKAKSNDPATWTDFETARSAYEQSLDTDRPFSGVGIVVETDNELVGVDLDGCLRTGNGSADGLQPWARRVLDVLPATYTEVTPSGTGLRLFLRGRLPEGVGNRKCLEGHVPSVPGPKRPELEWYTEGRYLTLTGQVFEHAPAEIAEADEDALRGVWEYVEGLAAPSPESMPRPAAPSTPNGDAFALASRAANAAKFLRLWAGDSSDYEGDVSRGDLAMLCILAFYTQDSAELDRLFRGSNRMRPKWDEKRGGSTWGAQQIEKALATVSESYTPPGRDGHRVNGHVVAEKSDDSPAEAPATNGPSIPASVYEGQGLHDEIRRACLLLREGHERDVFLTGLLPLLTAFAHGVRTKYGRVWKGLNLMAAVIAPAGSGKSAMSLATGCAKRVDDRLREEAEGERQRWLALDKDERRNGPEPPYRQFVFSSNASERATTDLLLATGGKGFMVDSEIMTLSTAQKQDWGDNRALLLKSDENEPLSRDRKGETPIRIPKPELAFALSGTPSSYTAWTRGTEDGQFSRVLHYAFHTPPVFIDQFEDESDEELDEALDRIARTGDALHQALAHRTVYDEDGRPRPLFFRLDREQQEYVNAVFARRLQEVNLEGRPELFASVKRGAFRAVRTAGALAAYRLQAEGADLATVKSYAPTNAEVEAACAIVLCYLEHAAALATLFAEDPAAKLESEERRRFFDALPATFKTAEAHEAGKALGMSTSAVERALKAMLDRHGLITRLRRGEYEKTSAAEVPTLPASPSMPGGDGVASPPPALAWDADEDLGAGLDGQPGEAPF
jgi:hypothetical protein